MSPRLGDHSIVVLTFVQLADCGGGGQCRWTVVSLMYREGGVWTAIENRKV